MNVEFEKFFFSFSFVFQKCLQFELDETVWQAKQRILGSFAKVGTLRAKLVLDTLIF